MSVIVLPSAAVPAQAPHPEVLAKIVVLHNYANAQRGFVTESWATRTFKRTYDLVYSMCQDAVDCTMGFEISYSPSRGDHIHAMQDKGYGSTRFHRDLPLAGELAETFIADLDDLAMVRAVADQKADEDAQLRLRARQRLDLVVTHGIRRPTRERSED